MTNYTNFLIETCGRMNVPFEGGRFKLTSSQMIELQKAFASEVASLFPENGKVYYPEHVIPSVILEHLSTSIR